MVSTKIYNDVPVKLLWTGGWDSTFRLLCLVLLEKKKVSPLYVIEHERKSTLNELAAMEKIRLNLLKKNPTSALLLLPTQVFIMSEIAPCQDITDKFKSISSRFRIGSQFEWLPRLARQYDLHGVELAIEKNQIRPRDPVFEYIGKFLVQEGDVFKPTESIPDKDFEIFKYFNYPVYTKTKLQMLDTSKNLGFLDLMLNTWFCHRPINGKPCGRCHPCIDAMEEGFAFRLPVFSKLRYHVFMLLRKIKSYLLILSGS